MKVKGIHHVTLLVDDEERAAWFYGEVLGLKEKSRPSFKFPGIFYTSGNQEIHIIIASRPLSYEDLFIDIGGVSDITRRHIHRHVALAVSEWDGLERRLEENGIEILFGPNCVEPDDELSRNMIDGWIRMYSGVPVFCFDPFKNLIELVPMLEG